MVIFILLKIKGSKVTNIDEKLLQKLEKLSALKINDDKREATIKDINKIVDFVENLKELDLDDKEASFSVNGQNTPFREDIVQKNDEVIETILTNAPQSEDRFFIVPKIIE